jgi:hypothetical protein
MEKKLPEALAALLTPEVVQGRSVRLMFQDEARFGRMARPKRCWAPASLRPVMGNGYERKFVYVYGAVSPLQGELDWRLSSWASLADNIFSLNPQTSRLNDFDLDVVQQDEALMFLVHFLGDIHLPLHTENMDRGGSQIPACFDHDLQ